MFEQIKNAAVCLEIQNYYIEVGKRTELKGSKQIDDDFDDLLKDVSTKAESRLSNSFFTQFHSNERLDLADGDTTALYSKDFTNARYVE